MATLKSLDAVSAMAAVRFLLWLWLTAGLPELLLVLQLLPHQLLLHWHSSDAVLPATTALRATASSSFVWPPQFTLGTVEIKIKKEKTARSLSLGIAFQSRWTMDRMYAVWDTPGCLQSEPTACIARNVCPIHH